MRRMIPFALLLLLGFNAARAQETQETIAPPGGRQANGCVEVEVNGERVRDHDCLSKLLTPPQDPPATQPAQLRPEEIAQRPSSALGLANTEATRQRLGVNFGKSTLPQRPARSTPTLPPALRVNQ